MLRDDLMTITPFGKNSFLTETEMIIGQRFKGLMNDCLVEVVDVKLDAYTGSKTVIVKDMKTSKMWEYGFEAFQHLLWQKE